MSTPLKIALLGPVAAAQAERLRKLVAAPLDPIPVPDERDLAAITAAFADAEVVVARMWPAGVPAPRLRLLQLHSAGVDTIDMASVPPGAVVCNAPGHEPAMAEYVVHGLLRSLRGWAELEARFAADPGLLDTKTGLPYRDELSACTVGILGLGGLGVEIARRLAPFGCRLVGCNRTPRNPDGLLESCRTLADVDAFCAGLDALVVACALVPETRGLVRMRHYRAMKPGAVVVNVARGEILDYDDLHAALSQRVLGGAVLDVWHDDRARVPPLLRLPGVIATPHVSAWTKQMVERRWRLVAGNVGRLQRGEALVAVVRPAS